MHANLIRKISKTGLSKIDLITGMFLINLNLKIRKFEIFVKILYNFVFDFVNLACKIPQKPIRSLKNPVYKVLNTQN